MGHDITWRGLFEFVRSNRPKLGRGDGLTTSTVVNPRGRISVGAVRPEIYVSGGPVGPHLVLFSCVGSSSRMG